MNITIMKKILPTLISLLFAGFVNADTYSVKSPNGKIEASICDGKNLTLTITADGQRLLDAAKIGMNTDRGAIGIDAKAKASSTTMCEETIEPVYGIRSEIPDVYNQLKLEFDKFDLLVRAYDESVAYRFVSKFGKGEMIVIDEILDLNSKPDDQIIAHAVKADNTSFEEFFRRMSAKELANYHSATPPLLMKKGSYTLALVESDLKSFPGLRIAYKDGLKAYHSKYPKAFKEIGRKQVVSKTENFIAKTDASREFPWRAFVVARSDKDLADNDTVYKLASPCEIDDTDWIQPGTCVWEWWNAWNLEGVNFRTGVNVETYRYYIDFAAENMIPYLLIDEGWVDGHHGQKGKDHSNVDENLVAGKTTFDVPSIIEYAHSKDVKVVLWVLGKTLNKYGEAALDKMKSWGADGIKVDFFDRDDQVCVELYERIAKLAADREMVVDFHGCQNPTGLQRKYPNVLNFEAVKGNEVNKWAKEITPSHNIDLVFTRMLQGPMDFTPGSMLNATPEDFKISGGRPMSFGTRAHQMAMYVIFYGPLQMLCDSPTLYKKWPDVTRFIAHAPTTWDDTKVLEGKIGEYIVMARLKDDNWYIAGMNSGNARDVEIDLSKFLEEDSTAKAEIFSDTKESANTASEYKHEVIDAASNGKLKIRMERDGGFVIKLTPKKFKIFGIELF